MEGTSGKKEILHARTFQVYQFIVATLCFIWLMSNNRVVGIIGGLLLAILAAIMISKPEFLPTQKRSATGDLPEFADRQTRLWGAILLVAAFFITANYHITTSAELGIALLVFGSTSVVCASTPRRTRRIIHILGSLVLCGGGAFLIYLNAPITLHAESLWVALGSIAGGAIWSSIGWVANRFGERGETARLAEQHGELSLPFASPPRAGKRRSFLNR